ncbi:hypothetical protein [Microlunatus sp. Gsoil 973]|uniref:hypothetical protein n=1 Tax=Microlunatus sp. Gsoil 973 TaxID=2672569 RepID=UPI0012B4D72C|nr:hypothetical protein [Microlunatus sp. Gsoil 973]QGN34193.1 hypothetical protein GJV80_16735 [Microlunatus sp. Gsoil 973]
MVPQYEHDLPNGQRLISVDVQTAQEYLPQVVDSFKAGNNEPLIIGDESRPRAVVIPVDEWLDLHEIAGQVAADRRLESEAGASIAEGGPVERYEDVLKTLYDPRRKPDDE